MFCIQITLYNTLFEQCYGYTYEAGKKYQPRESLESLEALMDELGLKLHTTVGVLYV